MSQDQHQLHCQKANGLSIPLAAEQNEKPASVTPHCKLNHDGKWKDSGQVNVTSLTTKDLIFQFELLTVATKRQLEVNGVLVCTIVQLLGDKVACAQNEFQCVRDHAGLFGLLHRRGLITFLNYDLLNSMIQEFGNEVCRKKLRVYEANLKYYCQSRLVQISPDMFVYSQEDQNRTELDIGKDLSKLAIKIEKEWKEQCLANDLLVGRKVASLLDLENVHLHIIGFVEG